MFLFSVLDPMLVGPCSLGRSRPHWAATSPQGIVAWSLELPAAKTEVLVPRAAAVVLDRVRAADRSQFLGHVVDSNASCLPCWRRARDQALARCTSQMSVARRARVPVAAHVATLDAVLWPAIMYRAPSWAPTRQVLAEADVLQRRCAAMAVQVVPFQLDPRFSSVINAKLN